MSAGEPGLSRTLTRFDWRTALSVRGSICCRRPQVKKAARPQRPVLFLERIVTGNALCFRRYRRPSCTAEHALAICILRLAGRLDPLYPSGPASPIRTTLRRPLPLAYRHGDFPSRSPHAAKPSNLSPSPTILRTSKRALLLLQRQHVGTRSAPKVAPLGVA